MQHFHQFNQVLSTCACGILIGAQLLGINPSLVGAEPTQTPTCQRTQQQPNFLAVGGGGAPSYNEIALEKNILYFERTLRTLRYNPKEASIFFANGNNRQATIRYIDNEGQQQFKVPQIPNLKGAATLANLHHWMQQTVPKNPSQPIFFYFTGHGYRNPTNSNNNALMLWNDRPLSVQEFSTMLDKLPRQTPVVAMMAQCYSGSFANMIYQGGNPKGAIALQTRCGFFATIKTLPSVGCTPAVNEADYRDYSSSFFAGLSGRNRTGQTVASADYNHDRRVSYAEAHAFAKVDEQTPDLPISTSEAWLQEKASQKDIDVILQQPIAKLKQTARPEQRYVIDSVVKMFKLNPQKSFRENANNLGEPKVNTQVKSAYLNRLVMELINISMEKKIRTSHNQKNISILNRLIKCEGSSAAKK
jgi:hypothetical protein